MSEEIENTEEIEEPFWGFNRNWIILPVLVGILVVVMFIDLPLTRNARLQNIAKQTLREIGAAQLAYQGTNNWKDYGTFDRLQYDMYLRPNVTKETIIPEYYLTWKLKNLSHDIPPNEMGLGFNTFTIIAWPDDPGNNNLRTFGISEWQELRVFNPDNLNCDPSGFRTWERVDE